MLDLERNQLKIEHACLKYSVLREREETIGRIKPRQKRKCCSSCYEENILKNGRDCARSKTKQVSTFRPNCPNESFLCLKCFEKHRINQLFIDDSYAHYL